MSFTVSSLQYSEVKKELLFCKDNNYKQQYKQKKCAIKTEVVRNVTKINLDKIKISGQLSGQFLN